MADTQAPSGHGGGGLDGDGGQHWVELNRGGKRVRIGPYKEPGKAKLRLRLETQEWRMKGGSGKQPEHIYQPPNTPPVVGITKPMYRQSPRTGKIANHPQRPEFLTHKDNNGGKG